MEEHWVDVSTEPERDTDKNMLLPKEDGSITESYQCRNAFNRNRW